VSRAFDVLTPEAVSIELCASRTRVLEESEGAAVPEAARAVGVVAPGELVQGATQRIVDRIALLSGAPGGVSCATFATADMFYLRCFW